MKKLGTLVAILAVFALASGVSHLDRNLLTFAVAAFACAATTMRSRTISSFLQIFVGIFSFEAIVFGLQLLLGAEGLWPASLVSYAAPESLGLAVATFSVLIFGISHLDIIRQATCIADRYFDARGEGEARIGSLFHFRSKERNIAVIMIVVLVIINQAQVGISVRLSFFNRDWFNAIQQGNSGEFWRQLLWVFVPWAFTYVAMAVGEFVIHSFLVIRWRRWLTEDYVSRWLGGHTHYHIALSGNQTDNPDQRIAEDIDRFIDGGTGGYGIYSYSILLISTITSLVSFSVVLWDLSGNFPFPGTDLRVPGLLFWTVLIYAMAGTLVTHLIGRALSELYFERQRREADFRFSLARVREYSEQVALLSGENAERLMFASRFGAIVANYLAIVRKRKFLLSFTATYQQLSPIIPYVITAPFYFAGKIPLGIMTQTASAFSNVETALTFFINYYTSLATFKSVLDRLTSFDVAINHAHEAGVSAPSIAPSTDDSIEMRDLVLTLPDGRRLVEVRRLDFVPGDSVLITGPSGSGKSTLLRAIVGVWPYGDGVVRIPQHAHFLLLPQRPYIPTGSLAKAATYPAQPLLFSRGEIEDAMEDARLEAFKLRLDEEDSWAQRLSGGEQQRVAIARVLLAKPDWLFLDEATSALDEELEGEIYRVLSIRLPKTTIVSVGHRSSLEAFHKVRVAMTVAANGMFSPQWQPIPCRKLGLNRGNSS